MKYEFDVAVIIPTKNPGAIFREVLPAVISQKVSGSFEIIVIDSGSTDGTVEYATSFGEIRVIEIRPDEFGHGRTRNLAIRHSRAEFCALITHDALPVNDDWLSELLRPAREDDQVAGVFGRHEAYPSASCFTKIELTAHFDNLALYPVLSKKTNEERFHNDLGWQQLLHFFSDNNALIRKSVWEEIPYPDVNFAEDQIWAKTIVEAGWKKAYANDAPVFHSHDYSLFERFQRSFDESLALKRLFGYEMCESVFALGKTWFALTKRDILVSKSRNLFSSDTQAVLSMPFDHFMRLLGHMLGGVGDRLPEWLAIFFSRDQQLFRAGSIVAKNGKESAQ
jgi:rhamnosyltransferase